MVRDAAIAEAAFAINELLEKLQDDYALESDDELVRLIAGVRAAVFGIAHDADLI